MLKNKLHTPDGMADFLPGACYHKRRVEATLLDTFRAYGYEELTTPMLEYLDVLSGEVGALPSERLFKLFDGRGRILAVRPESTMPIARVAATRMREAPLPLRLCYVQEQLLLGARSAGLSAQTQAGIELLGAAGVEADAEVIALAARALKAAGLGDIQIEIGQVEFFKGLMEEAGLSDEDVEQLRQYVEDKNMLAIEIMLSDRSVSGEVRARIAQLTTLYGGEEVLRAAEAITANQRALGAIDCVRRLLRALDDYGCADCVSVDLGMVHAINYYSGVIFRGITSDLGQPVLSGGRYDRLLKEFGREMPATGFAIEVTGLLRALESGRVLEDQASPDMLIGIAPGARRAAAAYADSQRVSGKCVLISFAPDEAGLAHEAAERGIGAWRFVREDDDVNG